MPPGIPNTSIGAPFRYGSQGGVPPQTNMYEDAYAAALPSTPGFTWTTGATLIDQINTAGSNSADPWQINSFSIQAQLILSGGTDTPTGGKLGKIRAGLTTAGATTSSGGFGGLFTPILPYPPDMNMIADLWDPSSDKLPPVLGAFQTGVVPISLPVNLAVNLPTPIVVPAGGTMGIGIWMEPSLLSSGSSAYGPGIYPVIFNAQWSVNYTKVKQALAA